MMNEKINKHKEINKMNKLTNTLNIIGIVLIAISYSFHSPLMITIGSFLVILPMIFITNKGR